MAAAAAARDGQTALALRLAKHLAPPPLAAATTNNHNHNVVFSPVSVHAALALTATGARGATRAQLLAFLGAPSADGLADFGRRVTDSVLADRSGAGGPRVLFGGGVWVDAALGGLTDAFRDVAAEAYKSEARTVSFTDEPEAAVKMMNEWVKKATDNLINSMISTNDINPATDLMLANAVYFKGDWMEPFQLHFTSPGTFHRLDGGHVEVDFMEKYRTMDVACMDGFKVLKLPYKPGATPPAHGQLKRRRWQVATKSKDTPSTEVNESTRYSMFVFLPDTLDGMATMVDVVTAAPAFMYSILAEMKLRDVDLKLPKFKITFNWGNLKESLCQLGLTLPFSPEAADLRGMCNGDEGRTTFLSKVAHMAVVNVNEKGTEAGAVAYHVRGGGGPPPDLVEYTADHPLTFFIMEERYGVIVFVGHVLDPTKARFSSKIFGKMTLD